MKKHRFNIFPEMKPDDYNLLRDDIRQNGYDVKNPIYTYDGDILDGWNRSNACIELGVTPVYKDFTGTDTAALSFVLRTNKRRNLDSSQMAVIANEAEELMESIRQQVEKERRERQAATQSKSFDNLKREPIIIETEPEKIFDQKGKEIRPMVAPIGQLIVRQPKNEHEHKTSHILAESFNTNRTYINEVKKLKKSNPELLEQIKQGKKTLPSVIKELKAEFNKPHVSNNSGENEWYTPTNIIELARDVMGSIDLDPASSIIANNTVKAHCFYTKQDNGLSQKWVGNVWMNPPYAQPFISDFCDKLVDEFYNRNVDQAIVLVNNATDTTWFHNMMKHSQAVCFTKGRIRFLDINGNPGAPLQGQAIIYFGEDIGNFMNLFNKIGFILINPMT